MCSFNVFMLSLYISTVSLNVTPTLDSVMFFNYLQTMKRYIIGIFFKWTVGIYYCYYQSRYSLVSVSDGQSNFILLIVSDDLKSEHYSSIQLPSSELQLSFSGMSCRLVGNFSLKIIFQLFNTYGRREKSSHISHKHNVCRMLELNVDSLWSFRKSCSCENVNSLLNFVSNDSSLLALLLAIDRISRKR